MAIVFSRPLQFLLTSASNPFANHLETIRLIHLLQSLISERSSRYFVLSDPIVSTFQLSFILNARASMKGRLLRSSHRSCSVKKGVLKSFEACNFTKKESLAQVFPANFANFPRATFLQSTSRRLLLTSSFKICIENTRKIYKTVALKYFARFTKSTCPAVVSRKN